MVSKVNSLILVHLKWCTIFLGILSFVLHQSNSEIKNMKIEINAEETNKIEASVNDTIQLESLRESVVPPFLMLMPFCDLPPSLQLIETQALNEEGVHGVTFVIKVTGNADGKIKTGFKDLQTGKVTHQKIIEFKHK